MKMIATNIQRFSLHDGPGIRTTVFLKGCSLRCPWCSNPENLKPEPEKYIKDGIEGTYGRYYTSDELVKECLKDRGFYEGKLATPDLWKITKAEDIEKLPGGVTFSGGEALLQMESLVPVCTSLHKLGIHTAIETALFVPEKNVRLALDNIDFFYCDMKILDSERCRDIQKGDLELYLRNLDIVMSSGIPTVIRVPVIGGYTDDEENRKAVKGLLARYRGKFLKVELLKEHNLSESKYKSLNMKMSYIGVSDELMECYRAEIDEIGIQVEICRI
ncbi:MAG: radical SAM protein [Synergistaceae bacterium]|nr:radical SAM protein [Synergistaceae bacterium]